MVSQTLTTVQQQALLDILSHAEVYTEIRNFRQPGSLASYGPPFDNTTGTPSSSPSLQALLSRFALTLPGLRDVSRDFWNQQIASIIEDFENANLSESYDKGSIGIRKTLATAASALIEYPVRGVFAGFTRPELDNAYREYDLTKSEELSQAFSDFLHLVVYGDVLDDLVGKAAETDKLTDHLPIVQAMHEFVLVNLASFMHYTIVLSPKGQYLLTLIDHANKLVPYGIIRQTLRIGNVASMINAMTRVVLAKMSMASLTNWMGLTQATDDGMNLMQHIISTVLHWDTRELKSKAAKIEKDKQPPTQQQLDALQAYAEMPREENELLRDASEKKERSLPLEIFSHVSVDADLTEHQHKQALEYLASKLAIRDRQKIIEVLCHSQPDHLTSSVRDLVAAYEPIIRSVHNAVDLSDTVNDFEHFLKDLLQMGRLSRESNAAVPTVGDFVQLLKKHQSSCHKFLHQCAKNGKEVTKWFHDWAREAASQFRRSRDGEAGLATAEPRGAGDLTTDLNKMFSDLSDQQRQEYMPILDAHAMYLEKLHRASAIRMAAVVESPVTERSPLKVKAHFFQNLTSSRPTSRNTSPTRDQASRFAHEADTGPGAYLARWQALLDDTPLTPANANGPVRRARTSDHSVEDSRVTDNDIEVESPKQGIRHAATGEVGLQKEQQVQRPDVRPVEEALLPAFRALLAKKGCNW